jgi:hypothetical protein
MKQQMKIKPRTAKQITGAGMTLIGGFISLPFIKFKDAKHYKFKLQRR